MSDWQVSPRAVPLPLMIDWRDSCSGLHWLVGGRVGELCTNLWAVWGREVPGARPLSPAGQQVVWVCGQLGNHIHSLPGVKSERPGRDRHRTVQWFLASTCGAGLWHRLAGGRKGGAGLTAAPYCSQLSLLTCRRPVCQRLLCGFSVFVNEHEPLFLSNALWLYSSFT